MSARARIGVAVPVPEPAASVLTAVRADVGDPAAGLVPPHVTLVPPTSVAERALPEVVEHLAGVAAGVPTFRLALAGTGTFRPVSPVVFVRVVRGGESCGAIQEAARSGPLAQELRFAYHPHVTIAHEVDEPALDRAQAAMSAFSAEFLVDRFALYQQGADGVWRVVRDLPLRAPASASRA